MLRLVLHLICPQLISIDLAERADDNHADDDYVIVSAWFAVHGQNLSDPYLLLAPLSLHLFCDLPSRGHRSGVTRQVMVFLRHCVG